MYARVVAIKIEGGQWVLPAACMYARAVAIEVGGGQWAFLALVPICNNHICGCWQPPEVQIVEYVASVR